MNVLCFFGVMKNQLSWFNEFHRRLNNKNMSE